MNVVGRNPPRSCVLHVGPGGAYAFYDPGTSLALENGTTLTGLGPVHGIVLEAAPASPALPRRIRHLLAELTGHVPFFAVLSEGSSELEAWAVQNGTIFDRFVVPQASGATDLPLLVLEVGTGGTLMATVFGDLQAEMAETHESGGSYTPAEHWEARAQQFGVSGRSVCYANAPRIINKMMHATQIEALVPAIRRAAKAMKRSSQRPVLMEFGCGIGRLARFCSPHVHYHGADISRSMVETARRLNPGTRFFTTQTLGRAEIPPLDIVMIVTVLHHNDRSERLKLLRSAARLARERVRLVLLEDLMASAQIRSRNMYPLSIESLLDEIAAAFGGTCTQAGFELLSYKPNDFVPRTGLIELDVWR